MNVKSTNRYPQNATEERRWYLTSSIWRVLLMMAVFIGMVQHANGLTISDHYSPRNRERPKRKSTTFIILHTTEGPTAGSLKKLHKNGEAHYLVDHRGHVYRIIHRNRVACHCGLSMWDGETGMDYCSVGIEVVGYHNQEINNNQCAALKELIAQLQSLYKISDNCVLTHSMVAYGKPNRWHSQAHRGRKRCGMLFAVADVRAKLGLNPGPAYDPDVKSGRLVVGDAELADVLYDGSKKSGYAAGHLMSEPRNIILRDRSAWDIAREAYKSASTVYIYPNGSKKHGNEISNWKKMPAGTRVLVLQGDSL